MSEGILNLNYRETLDKVDSYEEYRTLFIDELNWHRVLEQNTKSICEDYLFAYPNGLYSNQTKRKVDEFVRLEKEQEIKDWNKALNHNTQSSYEKYLMSYYNGFHSNEAKRKVDEFIRVEKENRLKEQRVRDIEMAKERARQEKIEKEKKLALDKDKEAWKLTIHSNKKVDYENYLKYHYNGLHSNEAKRKIDEFMQLEKKLEEQRVRDIEIDKERVRLAKIEQEKKIALDKEKEAWNLVCKKDTTEDYKNYLKFYPNGIYTTDAKLRIEEYYNDFKELIHLNNIRIDDNYGYRNLILYSNLDMNIKELKEAKYLDISGNSLEKLPSAISYLKNLDTLIVNRNNLITLPEWIVNLTKLKELNLDANKINEYPKNMSSLINIEKLNLGDLNIKEVPLWVKELKKLECLTLWHNQDLTKLPLWIDSMEYLNSLWIGNTKINNLSSFKNLIKRENLHIDATNLDISYLKKLELQVIFKTKIRIFM